MAAGADRVGEADGVGDADDADGGLELAESSEGDVTGEGEAESGVSEHPPSATHMLVTMPVTAQRPKAIFPR